MSCDYDVWCLDCEAGHGFDDANHQDKLMMGLAKMGPELAAIAPTLAKLESLDGAYGGARFCLQYDRLPVDFGWFAAHGNHRLIARDEYGRNVDECGEYFSCGECKHQKSCRRPRGHDGKHAPERDSTSAQPPEKP